MIDFESKKKDIALSVQLPFSTVPTYDKLASPTTLLKELKKAGLKLDHDVNMTVKINEKTIHLGLLDTKQPNLASIVTNKLNDYDVDLSNRITSFAEKLFSEKRELHIKAPYGLFDAYEKQLLKDNIVDVALNIAEDKMKSMSIDDTKEVAKIVQSTIKHLENDTDLIHIKNNDFEKFTVPFEFEKEFSKRIDTAINVQSINPKMEKNLEYLKDQIKYLGFGEDAGLHKKLEEKLKSPDKSFSLSVEANNTTFKSNKVVFDLNFSKSAESNMAFLNTFKATLKNEAQNKNIDHTFAIKNNGFTAKQAVNLLEGRAVKTEITNKNTDQKEDAFVKLKLNEEKNEKGNFKLQVFNKNYGVDVAKIAEKSNLVFQDDKHKDITLKSLEKGNVVAVKFKDEANKVVDGKAVLNPQYKTLNLYDNQMKRINTNSASLKPDPQEQTNTHKEQYTNSRKI